MFPIFITLIFLFILLNQYLYKTNNETWLDNVSLLLLFLLPLSLFFGLEGQVSYTINDPALKTSWGFSIDRLKYTALGTLLLARYIDPLKTKIHSLLHIAAMIFVVLSPSLLQATLWYLCALSLENIDTTTHRLKYFLWTLVLIICMTNAVLVEQLSSKLGIIPIFLTQVIVVLLGYSLWVRRHGTISSFVEHTLMIGIVALSSESILSEHHLLNMFVMALLLITIFRQVLMSVKKLSTPSMHQIAQTNVVIFALVGLLLQRAELIFLALYSYIVFALAVKLLLRNYDFGFGQYFKLLIHFMMMGGWGGLTFFVWNQLLPGLEMGWLLASMALFFFVMGHWLVAMLVTMNSKLHFEDREPLVLGITSFMTIFLIVSLCLLSGVSNSNEWAFSLIACALGFVALLLWSYLVMQWRQTFEHYINFLSNKLPVASGPSDNEMGSSFIEGNLKFLALIPSFVANAVSLIIQISHQGVSAFAGEVKKIEAYNLYLFGLSTSLLIFALLISGHLS